MEEQVDVTDEIEQYAKGKTVECVCGAGIGVPYGDMYIPCYACGRTLVDEEAGAREPPKTDDEQMTLGGYM